MATYASQIGTTIPRRMSDEPSFKEAFRNARAAGDKTFEWRGKTYTTKTAEEQNREIAAKAAPGSGRGPSAGRTAADRDVTVGRAMIPGEPVDRAEPIEPTMGSRMASGLSDTAQKALAATGITAGIGGLGYGLYRAKKARDTAEALRRLDNPAMEAAQRAGAERRAMSTLKEGLARDLAQDISSGSVGRGTPMRSTATTADTGRRFTPEQEVEAATSAMRGAVGRRQVQEARTGRSQAAAQAKAEKPVMRSDKAKESPRSRTRDEEDIEFRHGGKTKSYSKGGSVKGSGCEQRGLRKCKVY